MGSSSRSKLGLLSIFSAKAWAASSGWTSSSPTRSLRLLPIFLGGSASVIMDRNIAASVSTFLCLRWSLSSMRIVSTASLLDAAVSSGWMGSSSRSKLGLLSIFSAKAWAASSGWTSSSPTRSLRLLPIFLGGSASVIMDRNIAASVSTFLCLRWSLPSMRIVSTASLLDALSCSQPI